MGQHIKVFPNMTFTGASTTSNAITGFNDCRSLGFAFIDSSAVTVTHTIQVEPSTGGSDWVDLQSAGADVTFTSSEGLVVEPFPFQQVRLLGTGSSTGTTVQVRGVIVV